MLEVTPALVKAYLDSCANSDTIGYCRESSNCLVAYALRHTYPDIEGILVSEERIYYTDDQGNGQVQDTPSDIAAIIDGFDTLGSCDKPITKYDYVTAMESASWLR